VSRGLVTEPEILSTQQDGDTVRLSLHIPPGLMQFQGHFDNFPMLPGVVQVDWAIRQGRRHFSLPANFKRLSALKFMRVTQPGAVLELSLSRNSVGELSFRYANGAEVYSSGRALFAD
jgi:3-hydroxymyristoyl/3-hydroxydecanoyl-(acyl carrier protein) dehydratase